MSFSHVDSCKWCCLRSVILVEHKGQRLLYIYSTLLVYEQLWKSSYDRNNNKKNYQNHSLSTFQVVYNLDLKMVNKKGLGECLLSQQCHKLL
jgi:hypothetical protein